MNNNLIKKFLEYGLGSVLTLLIGFITSPIITRIISPEQNGKFAMFNTVTNLCMLITILGLDQAYVRYYYEEHEDNRGVLLWKCLKIPIIVNVIAIIMLLIGYDKVSMYIVDETSIFIVILLGINLLLSTLSRFILLEIRMRQKAKTYSFLNVLTKVVNLIFVLLIFLFYKDSYLTLVCAMLLTNLVVILVAVGLEKSIIIQPKKGLKLNTETKELMKYGAPLIFSMAITWVFQSIDKVTLKEFHSYAEIGLYNGAMTIIMLLNAVQSTFTTFWAPVAFEEFKKNPDNKQFFSKVNQIVTVVMLLIAVGLIATKDIIIYLLGDEYREAVFIFPFLVFMPIMYTISETTVLGINFMKKPKYHIYIGAFAAVTNLIGNLILVPSLGAKGAAISTGLAYVIFFSARTYYSKKLYSVNYELKKFGMATVLVYGLAIYSSFYRLNWTIVGLTFLIISLIVFIYRDIFREIFEYIYLKFMKKEQ